MARSSDGKVFAFEQYGVLDGSGLPYAEITVVDTGKDEWLPGTPFRKALEIEGATVDDVRKATADEAKELLTRLRIGEPGQTLFSDSGAVSVNGQQRVKIDGTARRMPFTLVLEERVLPSPECGKFTDIPVKGFTLSLGVPDVRGEIHRDETVPQSRDYPLAYAVTQVISYETGERSVLVFIIRMEKHGIEGPDSRYIAVTAG